MVHFTFRKIDIFNHASYSVVMISLLNKRSATSLRVLCEAAQEFDVEMDTCLDGTGITANDLEDPTLEIVTHQEIQTIENIAKANPKTVGLGVAVGKRLHVNAFGIWGFAILTSPTLREAILTAIEYTQISFLMADMFLVEEGETSRVVYKTDELPAITRAYIVERHSYVTINFIRELLHEPDYKKFRIEIKEPALLDVDELSNLISLEVITDASENALAFPSELLDRAIPRSDPASLQFCLDQCKALVEKIEGTMPLWSQKVRDAVIDNIGSEQQIEDVAKRLLISERTLRRRLSDEGTTFRDIYTDARMAIARELLEAAGLNVETVSWRVGYAEPASFVRAFSKKYGQSPGEVRKSRKHIKAA